LQRSANSFIPGEIFASESYANTYGEQPSKVPNKQLAPGSSGKGGLEITFYVDWVRAERRLVRALGALIKWVWVACDEMQKKEGHKFWYNAYWKTELAK
jgi:hypothetical protein